jgi:hypothetical protein
MLERRARVPTAKSKSAGQNDGAEQSMAADFSRLRRRIPGGLIHGENRG